MTNVRKTRKPLASEARFMPTNMAVLPAPVFRISLKPLMPCKIASGARGSKTKDKMPKRRHFFAWGEETGQSVSIGAPFEIGVAFEKNANQALMRTQSPRTARFQKSNGISRVIAAIRNRTPMTLAFLPVTFRFFEIRISPLNNALIAIPDRTINKIMPTLALLPYGNRR